jgi:5'-phosphate synthase pdxT subunit
MSKGQNKDRKLKIGILDIQGSVAEHLEMLKKIGARAVLVKSKTNLDEVNGLIIPGGESTVISKLLATAGLDKEIIERAGATKNPLAIWGTCAGAILMARKISNSPRFQFPINNQITNCSIKKLNSRKRIPDTLNLMDIEIERNAYGSQQDSFQTELNVPELSSIKFPAIFIRAPRVKKIGAGVKVMAKFNNEPVMLQQNNLLATMFHPELTEDTRVHQYFIKLTQQYAGG